MHVFIDTNILLNFLHFTKDELDALNNVFASHEHGSATVHLTQQVVDEFRRNRETKIADALKRFNDTKRVIQFPSFMKGYGEYEEIRKLSIDLQIQAASICAKAENDISNQTLSADLLIGEIFDSSEIIPSTPEYFQAANMRAALGNPPGERRTLSETQ